MSEVANVPRDASGVVSRCQKLLRQEVRACDDPVCCCEAEPRWLRLQQAEDDAASVSEWESLDRTAAEEL
jgi:hypothetical protein